MKSGHFEGPPKPSNSFAEGIETLITPKLTSWSHHSPLHVSWFLSRNPQISDKNTHATSTILRHKLGCDIGGAKELGGVIYFPTNWGAKEPQNLPNHRVAKTLWNTYFFVFPNFSSHQTYKKNPFKTNVCKEFSEGEKPPGATSRNEARKRKLPSENRLPDFRPNISSARKSRPTGEIESFCVVWPWQP